MSPFLLNIPNSETYQFCSSKMARHRSLLPNTATLFVLVAAAYCACPAHALDFSVVEELTCDEDRPVSLDLKYIGNEDSTLTLGKSAIIEGDFTYSGLKQYYNATEDSQLHIRARLALSVSGINTAYMNLVDWASFSVCLDERREEQERRWLEEGEDDGQDGEADEQQQQQAEADNEKQQEEDNEEQDERKEEDDGKCPVDGQYGFEANHTLANAPSSIAEWAISGYNGKLIIDIYLDNSKQLVGRCRATVEISKSGKLYEKFGNSFPSGRSALIGVFAAIGGFLAIILLFSLLRLLPEKCGFGPKKRPAKVPLLLPEEKDKDTESRSSIEQNMEWGNKSKKASTEVAPIQDAVKREDSMKKSSFFYPADKTDLSNGGEPVEEPRRNRLLKKILPWKKNKKAVSPAETEAAPASDPAI